MKYINQIESFAFFQLFFCFIGVVALLYILNFKSLQSAK